MSSSGKKTKTTPFNVNLCSDTIRVRSFKLRMILTLLRVKVYDLDLGLRSQVCQKHKLRIALFRFSSTVVKTLYGCYIHQKDHVQYDLRDCIVYSRRWLLHFWSVKCLGLSKVLTLGCSQTPIVINVKLCMMALMIEFYQFISLSVTFTFIQDQSSVKSFSWKCYVLIHWNLSLKVETL